MRIAHPYYDLRLPELSTLAPHVTAGVLGYPSRTQSLVKTTSTKVGIPAAQVESHSYSRRLPALGRTSSL